MWRLWKSLLHCLQLNLLAPACMSTCVFRCGLWLKLFSHWEHLNVFRPLCILRWQFSKIFLLNYLLQISYARLARIFMHFQVITQRDSTWIFFLTQRAWKWRRTHVNYQMIFQTCFVSQSFCANRTGLIIFPHLLCLVYSFWYASTRLRQCTQASLYLLHL